MDSVGSGGMDKIEELPPIPEQLKMYAREGRLTPFVGAGASQIAGSNCPGWLEFAQRLLGQLVDHGVFDHDIVDQIFKEVSSPRTQISIARNAARKAGVAFDFEKAIHPGRDTRSEKGRKLYGALGQLARSFVTTNYDAWLNVDFSPRADGDASDVRRRLVSLRDEISIARLNEPQTVVHLHGSLHDRDPANMVMTTSDYLARYAGDANNPVVKFLADLFQSRSVLFVGYGLSELEILEYVLLKKDVAGRSAMQHFILLPFLPHQLPIAAHLEDYFADFGVTLIPFNMNRAKYDQLVPVMEYLAAEMPARNVMNIARRARMEDLLNED